LLSFLFLFFITHLFYISRMLKQADIDQ